MAGSYAPSSVQTAALEESRVVPMLNSTCQSSDVGKIKAKTDLKNENEKSFHFSKRKRKKFPLIKVATVIKKSVMSCVRCAT